MEGINGTLTRRESIIAGSTILTTLIAGCSEDTSTGESDGGNEPDTNTEDTGPKSEDDESSEGSDTEETGEDNNSADSEEQTDENDSGDSDSENSEEGTEQETVDYITIKNIYMFPNSLFDRFDTIAGDDRYKTSRSTISTFDDFAVEVDFPESQDTVKLTDSGAKLRIDNQIASNDRIRIAQNESAGTVIFAIQLSEIVEPGDHTFTIELDDTVFDLPDGQTTVTESGSFTVEEPEAELQSDTFPPEDNVEIVLQTNLAPTREVTTRMQTKSGEDPAFFFPNEASVAPDGTVTFTEGFGPMPEAGVDEGFPGAEAMLTVRTRDPATTIIETDVKITEK